MSKSELSDFLNRRAAHLTRLTQALARALRMDAEHILQGEIRP